MNRVISLLTVLIFMSCTTDEPKTAVYSYLHDITDPMLAQPDADEFMEAVKTSDTENSIIVRYRIISDVDFNPVSEIKRKATASGFSSLFSNALDEKKKGKTFESECRKLLAKKDPIEGEANSSIFDPIMSELEYLSSLPEEHEKHLIIYSDLLENGSWLSYYHSKFHWLLMNDTEKIMKLYRERFSEKLTDIQNIKVHIVFMPETHRDNVRYRQLQLIYSELFEELDIPITFSANITKAVLRS